MNKSKRRVFVTLGIVLSLSIASFVEAKVKPATIFADNMVLQQQQANHAIWGTASPYKAVKITTSWDNQTYTTSVNADGRWKTTIRTPKAGGPYTITFNDGEKTILNGILIGEVWLCGGQSNMEMPMKGFPGQPLEENSIMDITNSTNPNIRFFMVGRNSIFTPQDNVKGSWEKANPESVKEFSAAAYYFGRMIQKNLNVPVGLIGSYWGASTIEAWMSREMLADFPEIKVPQTQADIKLPNQTPTLLYNGMLHPLAGLNIRGMLWYQGESNVEQPILYGSLLEKYVTSLRKEWNIGEFPFFYCQIAPYPYYKVNSAFFREVQANAETKIANSGVVILTDAGMKAGIHPQKKKTAGERLALQALGRTYGIKGITSQSPVYKSMKIQNDTVIIDFDRAPMGLTSYYKPLKLFTVAGEDQKFHPATKAWIRQQQVFVVSEEVKKPVAVRYAFENYVDGDLFGVEGLPISSFRTDHFDQ